MSKERQKEGWKDDLKGPEKIHETISHKTMMVVDGSYFNIHEHFFFFSELSIIFWVEEGSRYLGKVDENISTSKK